MQLTGLQLGGYHILNQIGDGGMGEVYLAEDIRLSRNVAIKVIRIDKLLSPDPNVAQEAIRLFRREAKAIAKLDHEHILPLYQYDEEVIQGMRLFYIVMPLCLEGSLMTWLRKQNSNPQFAPEEASPILLQAADALQHAHDKEVIHLDVKPANFLLRSQSNSNAPYLLLADFGIASIIHATTSAGIRGTPTYMAPELWEVNQFRQLTSMPLPSWHIIYLLVVLHFKEPNSSLGISISMHFPNRRVHLTHISHGISMQSFSRRYEKSPKTATPLY
jgi:eukaryotic-like serine/threonine-protein kinase